VVFSQLQDTKGTPLIGGISLTKHFLDMCFLTTVNYYWLLKPVYISLSSRHQDNTIPSLLLHPQNNSRDLYCILPIWLTQQDSCSGNRPSLSFPPQFLRLWKPPNSHLS